MIRFLAVQWFKRNGWRFVGIIPRKEKSVVLLVGPQSSWQDLLICIAVKAITHFEAEVLVDESAWSWKSRHLLRIAGAVKWPGGNPKEAQNRMVERLNRGNRSAVVFPFNDLNAPNSAKRHDFYPIAKSASTKLVLVAIDHRHRVIKFHNAFSLSGIEQRDISYINGHFNSYYWYVNAPG